MLTRSKLKEKVQPFAKRIRGVAHDHRLAILYVLAHNQLEAKDIVDALGVPENLVAHHLKQMYITGWVLKTKQGRSVTYRPNQKTFF